MKYIYMLSMVLSFFCFKVYAHTEPVLNKTKYDFLVRLPEDYDDTKDKQPLIVFLHGKSLSGNNLDRVQRYGVLYAANRGREIPGIVVAPQTSNGWNPDHVIEVVDYVLEHYNVDSRRVYICGMSMGGYGTMHVVGKYPNRFAAAVAVCGGGTLSDACNLSQVPLWIQHGSADRAVPASESKKIYQAIKQCNKDANAKLTIIPGGTHGSVERLFHQKDIYDWMLSHTK